MLSSNKLNVISPGIFCDQAENIVVRENNDEIHVQVLPIKNSFTQLLFVFDDSSCAKKYKIDVDFTQLNATVDIRGLYQLNEKQTVDIQTTMNHLVPHCESKQIWKGVLRDSAKAKFDGKIIVHPDAQKTVANLSNKNLLLSKTAEVNTKPTLEIYADDVRCTHGATVGFLDNQALFYLRSRGIEESLAHQMLVDAFVAEIAAFEMATR